MSPKHIRIEGKLEKIYKELLDIIMEAERRFPSSPSRSLTSATGVFLVLGFLGLFAFLTLLIHPAFVIGIFLSFGALFFVLLRLQYPKKPLTSLKPVVKYDTLKEIVRILPEYFPEENTVITIHTDYKTRKITNAFLQKSKIFKFFGKEFLIIPPERIEIKFSVVKWEIFLSEKNISLVLKSKIRIVSEQIRTKSGKFRDISKTFLKNDFIISKDTKKARLRITEFKKKNNVSRIPFYILLEPDNPNIIRSNLSVLLENLKE